MQTFPQNRIFARIHSDFSNFSVMTELREQSPIFIDEQSNEEQAYLNDTVVIDSDDDVEGTDTSVVIVEAEPERDRVTSPRFGITTRETSRDVNNDTQVISDNNGIADNQLRVTIPVRSVGTSAACSQLSQVKNQSIIAGNTEQTRNDEYKESGGDDDGESCPICFESWTNSGEHRLSSLKCGHLFGQRCIERWLAGQGGSCPQCNVKASKKDIRVIYAKALKVYDTSEKDRAIQEMEKEKEARKKAELESAETKLKYQLAIAELNKLKAEVQSYKTSVAPAEHNLHLLNRPSSSSTSLYTKEKSVKISAVGGCRVLAHNCDQNVICISQPSTNQLFPGFGIKKLSAVDFKTSHFIHLHSKAIRDVTFNVKNANSYLLTGSLDKTVKLTSLVSNVCVQTYNCEYPVWSCAWNEEDYNYLYAGLQNGTVLMFDMRNTSQYVHQFNNHGSRSPVLSVNYLPTCENASYSGVLIGQLDKASVYEKKNDDYKLHVLPIEGSLTSLYFERITRHMLVTLRPNAKYPGVRHSVFKLVAQQEMEASVISCAEVYTFKGGNTQKLLSRNALIHDPGTDGNLFACACDEGSQSVLIWDVTTSELKQKLGSDLPVLDICQFTQENSYLMSLTEKQATIFKWQ